MASLAEMEQVGERVVAREQDEQELARPAPAPPRDARIAMAAAMGNQAFGALVASGGVIARDPGPGATAAPPAAAATWDAPDFGLATQTLQARSACHRIESEARRLELAGFDGMAIYGEEARSWAESMGGAMRPLTAREATQLTEFGVEFKAEQDKAVRKVAEALVAQLTKWIDAKPISDEDLFELRETVHHQFVRSVDTDVLSQTVELVGKAEELIGEVAKWGKRAENAKHVIAQAKKLEDINKGIKEISDKVGEVKKVLELAQNIGKMTGALGKTPGGVDDIGAMEAALDVADFAVSKLEVPGFKQLWDGYIFKAAKICLKQLRALKEQLYKGDRAEGVRFFFEQSRGRATAPSIKDAYFHGVDPSQHFPGGQPMLDFMWRLMRDPDSVSSVPAGIEDFFVEWRDQMNAGAGEKLESDDDITNLWNVFSRERAPNIVGWLRRNRDEAWVKLYGGMPKPD